MNPDNNRTWLGHGIVLIRLISRGLVCSSASFWLLICRDYTWVRTLSGHD